MDRTAFSVADWRDFLEQATAAERQENLTWMRQVFAGSAEPTPSVVTPAPPLDDRALARLAQIRATRGEAPGGWNTPERAVKSKALATERAAVKRASLGPLPAHLSGPYLLAYRKRLGLTGRQIEETVGVWRGVLDRIEHDRHLGPQRQRQRLSEQRPAREKLLAYYQSKSPA